MGRPTRPLPAKLVIGLIWHDDRILARSLRVLKASFGPTDFSSPAFSFDVTDYYAGEMGTDLKRTFVGFRRLIRPEDLAAAKNKTNTIEKRLVASGKRRINIDPGYVSLAKLVLATTKNHSHRIYAGRGIFEEITLVFRNDSFVPLPHTYPDFRRPTHIDVFNALRRLYAQQIITTYGRCALSRCP